MPTRDDVFEALRSIEDPKLGMDIVELGLVYDVEVAGPKVKVQYSLTSMGCPAGPLIQQNVEETVAGVPEGRATSRPSWSWDTPLDAGEDVRRRQVHPRLRLAP